MIDNHAFDVVVKELGEKHSKYEFFLAQSSNNNNNNNNNADVID